MRRLVAAVLSALLASSSKADLSAQRAVGPTDADNVRLATTAVAALTKTFRAVGLDATDQGTTVSVSARTVGVTARINNRLHQNSRHIVAAQFDISVGGIRIPTLVTGAIGVGITPDDARDRAAAEWTAQYGEPIGFALASRFGASGPPTGTNKRAPFYSKLEVDGQSLFHGPPGLRGEAKVAAAVSSEEFVRKVAMLVVASLRRKPPASEYRSALVQVVVTGTAVTDGECRVDGLVSTELLERLSRFSWPEGSPSYMFKLFLVGSATRADR
jgi:hypothetical protein